MWVHLPVLTRRTRSGVKEKFNHLIQKYEKKLHKPLPECRKYEKRVSANCEINCIYIVIHCIKRMEHAHFLSGEKS